jgi:DNA invertase Pin-like site-specific DNA recombinase
MKVTFTQLDPEALKKELIDGIMKILSPVISDGLMTQTEVAEFYKVSKTTIIKWQKEGIINAYTIDNEVRYKKSELLESLVLTKHLIK